jgi:hypothetical protein
VQRHKFDVDVGLALTEQAMRARRGSASTREIDMD